MAHRKDKSSLRARIAENLTAFLTQYLYAREIRIRKSIKGEELQNLVQQAVAAWMVKQDQAAQSAPPRPEQPAESTENPYEKQNALMAKIGTGLWRLRKRMLKPGTEEPLDEMKRAYRQLESVWEDIHEAGYKIIDHTNTPYNEGLELRVIHYGQREGIDHMLISETVVPSILYNGVRIQEGEVYVDYPAEPGSDEPATQ